MSLKAILLGNLLAQGTAYQTAAPVDPPVRKSSLKLGVGPEIDESYVRLMLLDPETRTPLKVLFDGKEVSDTQEYVILQQSTEFLNERVTTTFSLGEKVMFTAGPAHKNYIYNGIILATESAGDLHEIFRKEYRTKLRASLGNNSGGNLVSFNYRGLTRTGVLTSLSCQKDATQPLIMTISLAMFVI